MDFKSRNKVFNEFNDSQVLYNYRINSDSISHAYTLERIARNDTKHVYEKLREYLFQWGMDSKDALARLNARWFNDTMYQFCKCYENAGTRTERNRILRYDWSSLLPAEVSGDHPYVSREYYRVYQWLQAGQVSLISLWFLKKKLYGQYKKLKRKRD